MRAQMPLRDSFEHSGTTVSKNSKLIPNGQGGQIVASPYSRAHRDLSDPSPRYKLHSELDFTSSKVLATSSQVGVEQYRIYFSPALFFYSAV